MKILQVCDFKPPAKDSMGAERYIECLAKGLSELGHDLYCTVHPDATQSIHPSSKIVKDIAQDFDILHFNGWDPHIYESYNKPWVASVYGYELHHMRDLAVNKRYNHIISVSSFAANNMDVTLHTNTPKVVHISTDPDNFIYQEKKDRYFLWIAGTDWGEGKGIFSLIAAAKRMKFKLKIAGAGKSEEMISAIKSHCDSNIEFIGAANGIEKAQLIANAKALILLTRLKDACPTTVSEALMSGTPVIGSTNGSMTEIVKHGVTGILCDDIPLVNGDIVYSKQLQRAVATIDKISPKACREYAMNNFHYKIAAQKTVEYYKQILAGA
jgi:glycosyltransferase involved in cell wall biosynthesis